MAFFVENENFSLRLCLTVLRLMGYWPPTHLNGKKLVLYRCYGLFCFLLINGAFLVAEVGDLCLIWGDLPLMTGTAFVLFTNMAHCLKCLNVVVRRRAITQIITDGSKNLSEEKSTEGRNIIKSCDQETRQHQLGYIILSVLTLIGWYVSAEKYNFPLRAWYPYDTNKSPVYELTYMHQVFLTLISAMLNVSEDTLESTSDAVSLKLSSETLQFTQAQETILQKRIKSCAIRHQKVLETISLLQNTFSEPTFFQFTVSLIIICATAFELVSQTKNYVRFISMGLYLLDMMWQVFIYCYEGEHLLIESEELAEAAYDIPWYSNCVRTRRSILIIMVRCRRCAKLNAGAFTTLSLTTFMAIIKTSYSLFTLLQQVTE